MTLIAEDLLLLLLDGRRGTVTSAHTDLALGGAVLAELALMGAVTVPDKARVRARARVRREPGVEVSDPLLRDALDLVASKERSAQDLVRRLSKGLRGRLGDRLAEQGLVERRVTRVLGMFPRPRWPVRPSAHEDQVRRALAATLVGGAEPDDRTGALVALLSAVDRAHRVVDHEGLSSHEVRRRAKQVAKGDWAARAVRDAVLAATAATTAAITAASSSTSATGG